MMVRDKEIKCINTYRFLNEASFDRSSSTAVPEFHTSQKKAPTSGAEK